MRLLLCVCVCVSHQYVYLSFFFSCNLSSLIPSTSKQNFLPDWNELSFFFFLVKNKKKLLGYLFFLILYGDDTHRLSSVSSLKKTKSLRLFLIYISRKKATSSCSETSKDFISHSSIHYIYLCVSVCMNCNFMSAPSSLLFFLPFTCVL
jgi:hypothetical protein